MSLRKLHVLIQIIMGWNNSHLHKFEYAIDKRGIGREARDESKSLADFLKEPKDKLGYEYDFGDSWMHLIELEKIEPREEGKVYPFCVTGRMIAPIDDCGGIGGFYELVDALQDPDHPEHEDLSEWIGGEAEVQHFLSKNFDKNEINERINRNLEVLQ